MHPSSTEPLLAPIGAELRAARGMSLRGWMHLPLYAPPLSGLIFSQLAFEDPVGTLGHFWSIQMSNCMSTTSQAPDTRVSRVSSSQWAGCLCGSTAN